MSNLSENLKKHFTDKFIDLIFISCLVGGVFIILGLPSTNQYLRLVLIAVLLIIIWVIQKYTNNWLENWEVPSLNKPDQKKYNYIDTAYGFVVGIAFIGLFYLWQGGFVWILFAFIILMIVVREYRKWKLFKKEFGPD